MPNTSGSQSSPNPSAYLDCLHQRITALEAILRAKFSEEECKRIPKNLDLEGRNIENAGAVECQVLEYKALNPPIDTDGFVSGPAGASVGNIPVFSMPTGKNLVDSGIPASSVGVGLFSAFAGVPVTGIAETDMLAGASTLGSLSLPANQQIGMVIRAHVDVEVSNHSGAAMPLVIRTKANGITMLTHAANVPNGATNAAAVIDSHYTVQQSNLQLSSVSMVSGGAVTVISGFPAYDPSVANTFQVTAQWGGADPTAVCTLKQLIVTAYFVNDV